MKFWNDIALASRVVAARVLMCDANEIGFDGYITSGEHMERMNWEIFRGSHLGVGLVAAEMVQLRTKHADLGSEDLDRASDYVDTCSGMMQNHRNNRLHVQLRANLAKIFEWEKHLDQQKDLNPLVRGWNPIRVLYHVTDLRSFLSIVGNGYKSTFSGHSDGGMKFYDFKKDAVGYEFQKFGVRMELEWKGTVTKGDATRPGQMGYFGEFRVKPTREKIDIGLILRGVELLDYQRSGADPGCSYTINKVERERFKVISANLGQPIYVLE